jgi:hypothetical protein
MAGVHDVRCLLNLCSQRRATRGRTRVLRMMRLFRSRWRRRGMVMMFSGVVIWARCHTSKHGTHT